MKPGTLLRIYQHLRRLGVQADVCATGDTLYQQLRGLRVRAAADRGMMLSLF